MKKIMLILAISMIGVFAQYNPPSEISSLLDSYRKFSDLSGATSDPEQYALNIVSWQMDHGGFSKAMESNYENPYDGEAVMSAWVSNGIPLGTFDNNATVIEIRFLADQYTKTSNSSNKETFKNSIDKALGFILTSQFPTGAWPQVYPERTGTTYSNLATYNDDAMARVMILLKDITDSRSPFSDDLISSSKKEELKTALEKSVDYTLKAQIVNDGKPTVWCQQHDPVTYEPRGGRSYELASKSGSESRGIVYFLMNWSNQNQDIYDAVTGAYNWYVKNKVSDLKWSDGDFIESNGSSLWYRFYNVEDDTYFFANRDGTKVFDIEDVDQERRDGYQWAGDYGSKFINAYQYYNPEISEEVDVFVKENQLKDFVTIDNNNIILNLNKKTSVSIYDLLGSLSYHKTHSEGISNIAVDGLVGNYIVKLNNRILPITLLK